MWTKHDYGQYNIGLKYQCVKFVKRYYYEHLNHKMPDSYGHEKDFFDNTIADGQLNKKQAYQIAGTIKLYHTSVM